MISFCRILFFAVLNILYTVEHKKIYKTVYN